MHNVVPAQALSRRSRRLLYAAAALVIVAAIMLVVGVFLRFVPLVVPSNPAYPTYVLLHNGLIVVGGALLLAAGAMAARALTWKQDNPLALSTGEVLAGFLDERFVFIRNISRSAIGYVDAVLVGPPGVLVFRISERQGVFYNEGNRWMLQENQGDWKPLSWSPTDEAIADIRRLRDYLEKAGIANPQVFGVVVFVGQPPATTVTAQQPTVPVAQLDELRDRLLNNYLAVMERHDATTVTRVAELLYH